MWLTPVHSSSTARQLALTASRAEAWALFTLQTPGTWTASASAASHCRTSYVPHHREARSLPSLCTVPRTFNIPPTIPSSACLILVRSIEHDGFHARHSVRANGWNWRPRELATKLNRCATLKVGINASLTDIQNNHPNDLASVIFYSGLNQFSTARVNMGKDFSDMQNCLFFPYNLLKHAFSSSSSSYTFPLRSARCSGICEQQSVGNQRRFPGECSPRCRQFDVSLDGVHDCLQPV